MVKVNQEVDFFVANQVSAIFESTAIDEWFHTPSHDKPAENFDTRRKTIEALEDIDWVKSTDFLKTNSWLFKPELEILTRIFLIEPLNDLNACVEKIAHLKPPNQFLSGKK